MTLANHSNEHMIDSVVVASNRDLSLLDGCLRSLEPLTTRNGIQLIVARAARPASSMPRLAEQFPFATFLEAPRESSIPCLRGLGLLHASGRATAVTEDHCIASPDWLDRLSAAIGSADVVGGSMDNAQRGSVNWGAYFSEYGLFSPTRPERFGGLPLLTGANVAYVERVRARVASWAAQGWWENRIHARLHEDGYSLRFARDARVLQNSQYQLLSFCRDRFQHGRNYAQTQGETQPLAWRVARATSAPMLALVLTARVARASAALHRGAFARALPFTIAFLASWSAGEAAGYLSASAPFQS